MSDRADMPAVHPPLTPEERVAYECFYQTFWTMAVESVRFTLDDPDMAEDIAQQAFLKIWCNWSTVAALTHQGQRGYVRTAVKNVANDELRHRMAHPGGQPTSLERETEAYGEAGRSLPLRSLLHPLDKDPENDPERVLLAKETLDEVLDAEGDSALRRLEVLLLAEGYGPAEVAARMRTEARRQRRDRQSDHYLHATSSSVKMRRARHRSRLQQWGAQDNQKDGENKDA